MANAKYKYLYLLPLVIVPVLLLVACSTTKRLGPDDTLYTGVKKLNVKNPDQPEKFNSELKSQISEAINVPPNNPMPFMSPYARTPFPIGLWVYNNWNDSAKGLKGWLYRKLVAQPVLLSDVRPKTRTKMIEQLLNNNGYFNASANYEILYDKRNNKKARITYNVDPGKPYRIDSLIYLGGNTPLEHFIDSVARRSKYLRKGEIFSVDSLAAERVRITNSMRNKGYYYFRPEFIEFLADTMLNPGSVALKLTVADNTPPLSKLQYRVGNIYTTIHRRSTRRPGTPDTISTNSGDLIVMRPMRIRMNMVPSCISFRKGKLLSVRNMDRTQTKLSQLGIFSAIELNAVPADTSAANPTLDMYIDCKMDRPMVASIELNAVSKSNSYIGPGLTLGLTHNNVFGGAEKFNISLSGSYEWQTGRGKSSVFNSYEAELSASLAFPRLLLPGFIPRIKRELNWTYINLSASILNRPHYFRLAQFNTGLMYELRATRHTRHQITPFKLTYTKTMHTTAEFDSIMDANPAVALSFRSQFIPQLSYTYTLDKYLERERMNGINFTATITEAGNIFDGIWSLCGVKGEKKLFGTPFSQFIKGEAQIVYSRRLVRGTNHWLVSRLFLGIEHAYGNSSQVPYSEQFYIGGANSIRAFTVRSIGPGSFRAPADQVNGYFDQTGTFKIELNTEYRFPIAGPLFGAAFLDAGNIWLLKNDPDRPGGQLKGKTFFRDLALGTGIGLRVDLGMIVVRGDLGYGLHTPYDNGTGHYFNVPFKDAFAFHLAIGYPF